MIHATSKEISRISGLGEKVDVFTVICLEKKGL